MSTLRVDALALNDTGNASVSIANSWNVSISTSGATRFLVTSNGRVGIGTTNPTANLDVSGTTNLSTVSLEGSVGTAGQVLTSNGSSGPAYWGGGGFSNMQVFTANGTFTVPASITKVKVTVVGGGAGGRSAVSSTAQGGGGAGGAAIEIISGLTPGNTIAVIVGAGGAANTNGQTSSFGAFCSATGGLSPAISSASPGVGGAGGTATGGDINFSGGAGNGGSGISGTVAGTSGNGGSSIFGGAGLGLFPTNSGIAGAGASGTGAGGAGGNGVPCVGGAGGSGIVIVEY